MIKMMIVGRRRSGMTLGQAHSYMKDVHGAAVVKFIGEQPQLAPRRYVQNHVIDGSFRVPGDAGDTFAVARDFVTQVWFDDPAQAAAAMQAPFYREFLQPDEDRFVDQSSVVKLPVTELATLGGGGRDSASKLFVFHRAAAGVGGADLAGATAGVWAALLADAGNGIECVVRNAPLQRPGPQAGVDLVDEVWLRDDEAARLLGERWLDLAGAAPLGALLAPGATLVLAVRQHVLFAGAAA